MKTLTPLSLEQITHQLDHCLDVEFSFLKTEIPAQVIADLERTEQDYILDWVARVASTNIQLAYQFINHAVAALDKMDRKIIEAWALHAMDTYDQAGLHKAMDVIHNVDNFVQLSHERRAGTVFQEQASILHHFAHGLSGRKLKLEESATTYTDTDTIFLPALIAILPTADENFKVYKALVAYHWAQVRYGTFRLKLNDILAEQHAPDSFLKLFHALESLRLEACLARELPGLYREILAIRQQLQEPAYDKQWQSLAETLAETDKTVFDVLQLTQDNLQQLTPPAPSFFHGQLQPEQVEQTMSQRIEKEKNQFRSVLRHILDEIKNQQEPAPTEQKFEATTKSAPSNSDLQDIELTLDGQPMPIPEQAKGLSSSIIQDLGDIPDDYLVPAGPGEYDPSLFQEKQDDPDDVWKGTYHEEGAFLYKEWDYRRQYYRKNWCAVRESAVSPVYDEFYSETLHKYGGLIKHLRKTFEAMRDEDRLLKRQADGDDIDLDALVEALADAADGSELSERLFTHMHRTERNIAVLFMVDMSGSTKGWINDAERESLILLCETLQTLGDRYAIYGFSGMARKRCEIYRIKEFAEPYNDEIKARISGIKPKDYTRMGFAIRHLSQILNNIEARTRILITISDGKPDDYDSYRGEYGIEDTRRALLEARREGIHPYCITIDKEARDYLPHLYGPASYSVIDEVSKLPYKVSDIYRRLTT